MPQTVIVGSGFAGLGTAIRLAQAGRSDFVILEQADRLGGTWRDNNYPGCACDVPSHLYSLSFAPNPDWSHTFASAPEIQAYLERLAERHGLLGRIRFGVRVTGADYDERTGGWQVSTADGEVLRCRFLVLGTGALHSPRMPEIDGLARYEGHAFHSARWDHGHDLTGKRVAVIGTGASAIQLVPQIANRVAALTVFQRTPPWILPRGNRAIPESTRRAFGRRPWLAVLRRAWIYTRLEAAAGAFLNPRLMTVVQSAARAHLRRQVPDARLRRTLTPDYTIGCKRILLSDDYYPALRRPNVAVVIRPITRIGRHGVVTADGREHPADVIVFGTGFTLSDPLRRLNLVGRDGVKLGDVWRDGPQAYLGTTVAGFPNLFLLPGPNTGLAHSSMIYMIESQIAHVLAALRLLDRTGAAAIDVRPQVQRAYNAELQRRLAGSVWNQGGCSSWYLDEHGVNRALWPDYTFRFRRRTRTVDPSSYELIRQPGLRG